MRSGLCLPLAPTTSSTSASSSSHSTPSPTPTLIASSPSFAALASSPSALCTAGGSPSMPCGLAATDAADTVLMAVGPPVLVDLFALATVPTGPDEAGGPPPTKFYELRDNLLASGGRGTVGGPPGECALRVVDGRRAAARSRRQYDAA